MSGAIAAITGLGVLALSYQRPLRRLLEDPPAPYDENVHGARMRVFMESSFPSYVVAVSQADDEERRQAAARLIEASAFHDGLARRTRDITDAVDAYVSWSNERRLQLAEDASDRLDAVSEELRSAEHMLRRIGAPFSIDPMLGAYRDGSRWRLRLLVRTSEVLGVSRYRPVTAAGAAAAEEIGVLRVRRLDRLNLVDLAHGKASGDYAQVLAEGPRKTVNDRYLPALAERGELRDLYETPTASQKWAADALRPALVSLLPEDLRRDSEAIGRFASARRSALEGVDRALRVYGRGLIEPAELFVNEAWYERIEAGLGTNRHADALAELKRHALESEVAPDLAAKLTRASDAIFDSFSRGVECHEAWHLLVPDPPPVGGMPAEASKEAVAYLGELASAGPELPLMRDAFVRLHRQLREGERATPTSIAIVTLAPHLLPEALVRDNAETEPVELRSAIQEPPAETQARARRLLRSWYGEDRLLERVRGDTSQWSRPP